MSYFATLLKEREVTVQHNVPLSSYTSFHVGGPAKYFAVIEREDDLVGVMKIARDNDIDVFVMGGGSNVLVSDEGFDGLVIHCQIADVRFDGNRVHVGSGAVTAQLAAQTVSRGLTGLEWSVGIPGRIGGAIRGNAGAMGGEFRDVITSVRYLDNNGVVQEKDNAGCVFNYRESIFKTTKDIILSCTIELQTGDRAESQMMMREYLMHRNTTQPKGFGSSGCMFKNYECTDDEVEALAGKGIPQGMLDARRISAGWLVEHASAKGVSVGDVQVSDVHGNFVVNKGRATAGDVRACVDIVKQKISETFGVDLIEEVQYIGFRD